MLMNKLKFMEYRLGEKYIVCIHNSIIQWCALKRRRGVYLCGKTEENSLSFFTALQWPPTGFAHIPPKYVYYSGRGQYSAGHNFISIPVFETGIVIIK